MKSEKDKYKTVRIHPEDYRDLRVMAYHKHLTMVDCVSYLINEEKRRILEDKIDTLEVIPFINIHHKELFIKYVGTFPWDIRDTHNLVIFYTYAALGIIKEDKYSNWQRDWEDTIYESKSSGQFSELDEKGKQLVEFASVVLKADHEAIVKVLLNIDDSNLSIAKAMVRLKFNGIEKLVI
ncbi:hypothetical protein CYL18_14360 [Pradoshia eiseniae]|uniref:Uncharacterized protein n=1 Tax=Pradoshia eiseniae TaxID=2064768 RepID=A0A2S7MXC1_9BACI|nr:hypothetical protein [Pradoshia eiseniae]PQD94395.1 hypothetical protein CYL18_14360 [Pradoshia eiseniae]